ncbi:MAG: hypothetical protein CSA96_09205 [Bacteroidetes bacterium]|nr:MAG: hypothetical protein CSA96_09205 [Bacteroidota bacterium]
MKTKRYLSLVLSLFLLPPLSRAQVWEVPADQAAVENPSEYILKNVERGKELYLLNCKSCHGDPGKNNPLALSPLPVDIASAQMQENSDGALFYKISQGRGTMPPFASTLPENDRWMLVNFIRNYNPGQEALLSDAPPVKARLRATVDPEKFEVGVFAEYEAAEGSFAPLANAEIAIGAERAFGQLPIGTVLSDENGRGVFALPENLIGDVDGLVSIVVSLGSGFEAEALTLAKAPIGKPKEVPVLIHKGILWSTNAYVSPWILFSFLIGAGGAWLAIGYVILQIVKINRQGRPE